MHRESSKKKSSFDFLNTMSQEKQKLDVNKDNQMDRNCLYIVEEELVKEIRNEKQSRHSDDNYNEKVGLSSQQILKQMESSDFVSISKEVSLRDLDKNGVSVIDGNMKDTEIGRKGTYGNNEASNGDKVESIVYGNIHIRRELHEIGEIIECN